MSNKEIRVRIPPSPTGYCHVGTARTALLNFLFARKRGGKLVMRIEDTDKERSTAEFEKDIIDSIAWLGIFWDEFYRQSERMEIYKKRLHELVDSGKAYLSEEESKKEAGKTANVVRLRNPGAKITFNDLVRGDISFDTKELGDFVIARNLDEPLYHFAVVVDDEEMRISHVIRGEDHISNTPRQILIQEAFGFRRPLYAHFPLNLAQDRSKLSKRKGDVSVRSFREKGFLPEALVNYLAVIGWTAPSGKEILSMRELIDEFDISGIHKSGSIFDMDKLRWFNRQYLLAMDDGKFTEEAIRVLKESLSRRGIDWSEKTRGDSSRSLPAMPAHAEQAGEMSPRRILSRALIQLLKERISVWDDIRALVSEGELDFFFIDPVPDVLQIPGKNSPPRVDEPASTRPSLGGRQRVEAGDAKSAILHLSELRKLISAVPEADFKDAADIKRSIWEYATKEGRGAVLWPLRYALSGRVRSPDPFEIAIIIGKDAALRRIEKAVAMLQAGMPAH